MVVSTILLITFLAGFTSAIDSNCAIYAQSSKFSNTRLDLNLIHHIPTLPFSESCNVTKAGFVPASFVFDYGPERSYLIVSRNGTLRTLSMATSDYSSGIPYLSTFASNTSTRYYFSPTSYYLERWNGSIVPGFSLSIRRNGVLVHSGVHLTNIGFIDFIQNEGKVAPATQTTFVSPPGLPLFSTYSPFQYTWSGSSRVLDISTGVIENNAKFYSNALLGTPHVNQFYDVVNPTRTIYLGSDCTNNGTHVTVNTSCSTANTLFLYTWCYMPSGLQCYHGPGNSSTTATVYFSGAMAPSLTFLGYVESLMVSYQAVFLNSTCTGSFFEMLQSPFAPDNRTINAEFPSWFYTTAYSTSVLRAYGLDFRFAITCPLGGNISLSALPIQTYNMLSTNTGYAAPMLLAKNFQGARLVKSLPNVSLFLYPSGSTSIFSRSIPEPEQANTSLAISFPMHLISNESRCQTFSGIIGSCNSAECTYTSTYDSCNAGELARVVIQEQSNQDCRITPGEPCTLTFPRPLKTTNTRFIGFSGQEVFYSSYFTVRGSSDSSWEWECAPLCGIPWLQDLAGWARWTIGVVLLFLGYMAIGFVFQKIRSCSEIVRAPVQGWVTAFGFAGTFLWYLWYYFMVVVNRLMCGFFKNYLVRIARSEEQHVPGCNCNKCFSSAVHVNGCVCPVCGPSGSKKQNGKSSAAKPRSSKVANPRLITLNVILACLLPTVLGELTTVAPLESGFNGVSCTPLSVHYTNLVPVAGGIGFKNMSLTFSLPSDPGSSICLMIDEIDTPIGPYALSHPIPLLITTVGSEVSIADRYPVPLATVSYQLVVTCECPTGATHYCDNDHSLGSCRGSPCSIGSLISGSSVGCNGLLGSGHYCPVLSVPPIPSRICSQFPIRQPIYQPRIMVQMPNYSYVIQSDNEETVVQGPFGSIVYIGSYQMPPLPATGIIVQCGDGAFYYPEGPFLLGGTYPPSSPGFMRYSNNLYYGDISQLWSSVTPQLDTTSCTSRSLNVSVSQFSFSEAMVSHELSVANKYLPYGTVVFRDDSVFLSSFHGAPLNFELFLNASSVFQVANSLVASITAVTGFGFINQTTSGILVDVVVSSPGLGVFMVGGFSTTTSFTNSTRVSIPYSPSSTLEIMNVTLCDALFLTCVSWKDHVTFEPYIPQTYRENVGLDGQETQKPSFWNDGFGSNFRVSTWGGFKKLAVWLDVLIFGAIGVVLAVLFAIGMRAARASARAVSKSQ